jgi:glycosyltransferase involved in cell wall biosynthesis
MYRRLRVAIVIPAHNEAKLLPQTLAGLPDFADHIIVVDDASTDGTIHAAQGCGDPRIKIIERASNGGVGAAIVTGYQHALSLDVDVTVVVGADAQMDPEEMSLLLNPILNDQADYVKGDRLGHPEVNVRMPKIRLIGNRILTRLTRLSTGYRHIRDSQCGYTAISTDALRTIALEDLYPRYGFPNDVLAKLAEYNFRVMDQPVTPIYGSEQSGIRIYRVIMPILWLLFRAGVRRVMKQKRIAALPKREIQHRSKPTEARAQ